ncbi:DUF7116 family protein [Haloarchaeobius iranensis]|uniref:Uncharacterized protein n=1 Tax=Haloarchaeobius iranensis TaxID=996166 RepID=A0A1G9VWM7_9EURY|nr:hypothetical protein [Haloarchaeobius iranensis]SDM76679.1 hypothetical protein SAMN05192554_10744 [Haloarchaeobius iranensis]
MCPVNTNRHLREEAESIFSRLGYTVTTDGDEVRAERDWKVVHVTATEELHNPPESASPGAYRCFVTRREHADAVRRRVRKADPEYEWAVIGVDDEADYEVERAPPAI